MFDPNVLDKIEAGNDISVLPKSQLKNIQRALSWMTYPISVVDGLIGPNTRNAYSEFKSDIGENATTIVTDSSNNFAFDNIDKTQSFLRSDTSDAEKTKLAIAGLCKNMGIGLDTQIAYVLATAKWETNHTFKPVREAYYLDPAKAEAHLKQKSYYPYYGRGYVQLTWKRNYSVYSTIMREKLTADPDAALDPEISLFVLVHGFKLGKFTGRKIEDYITSTKTDFKNARKCINGLDKWAEIKKIAEGYL